MRKLEDCKQYEMEIDGVWTRVHWEQLDEGDVVRELNPDGSLSNRLYCPHNPYVISEIPHLMVDRVGETRPKTNKYYCLFLHDSLDGPTHTTAIVDVETLHPHITEQADFILVNPTRESFLKDRYRMIDGLMVSQDVLKEWLTCKDSVSLRSLYMQDSEQKLLAPSNDTVQS